MTLAIGTTCGWHSSHKTAYSHQVHINFRNVISLAALKAFSLTDELNVSLTDLGAHLKTHWSDVYSISPRRFEELIEDVFKHLGYRTRLTQATRDGGADIIILDKHGGEQAIVEVKRYAEQRRVGVGLVRQLIGSQYLHHVDKSFLVTSSTFTQEAISIASSLKASPMPFEMDLWDSTRVLQELGLYNSHVIPIERLRRGIPLSQQVPMNEGQHET
jgi:restriction endonuclease Mrr